MGDWVWDNIQTLPHIRFLDCLSSTVPSALPPTMRKLAWAWVFPAQGEEPAKQEGKEGDSPDVCRPFIQSHQQNKGLERRCKKCYPRGAWVAQSVKHLTLDFSSGLDLRVMRLSTWVELCAGHGACFRFSLPLFS